jgi:ornithine cyclodeaminase/alanine dehydrogenase-like protein (mu-crystallin family)
MAPGRTSEDEITCFKSLGIAIEDLAAAELAIATAESQGIGTVAPW